MERDEPKQGNEEILTLNDDDLKNEYSCHLCVYNEPKGVCIREGGCGVISPNKYYSKPK